MGMRVKISPTLGRSSLDGSWIASAQVRAGYAWETYHLYTTLGLAFTDLEIKTAGNQKVDFDAGVAL